MLKQTKMDLSRVLKTDLSVLQLELSQSQTAGLYTAFVFILVFVIYMLLRNFASPYDGVTPVF